MTEREAGMTAGEAGMTKRGTGMTERNAGMTEGGVEMTKVDAELVDEEVKHKRTKDRNHNKICKLIELPPINLAM